MRRFLSWLEAHGATFSSAVTVDARTRQLHATREFVHGQFLMHIPRGLMITREVAQESEIGKLIHQHASPGGKYEYMAAFLMQIRREGGFWKPYVDILPTDFSNHPLFFSEAELEYLKGSHFHRKIRDRRAANEGWYRQLPPSVKEAYSLEEFTWARCIRFTRTFGVSFNGVPGEALVPLADMLDHSLEPNARYLPESETGFVVTSPGWLQPGTALFTSYGAKSNEHLLIGYGFCLEHNAYNEVEIHLQPLPDGHPFAGHTKKLGETIGGMRAFRVTRSCGDDNASAALSYLRLAHSDASLRIDNAEVQVDNAGKIRPVSRVNEIAVLTALAEACARRLPDYPTSIAEDDALLKDPALPRNVRNMVLVRRDEKIILNYLLDLTRIALPALRGEPCDPSEHAAKGKPYAKYFAKIMQLLER
jgi:histone-lysine N-methyltransferase SETD3